MIEKKNVLLVGDNTDAPWHPLEPARRELEAILGGEFQLVSTEDYDRFAELEQGRFALCISYTDCWNRDLTPEQTAGLLRYVAGRGGLLVIHNGISVQRSYELCQLIGARFTGHPPYQTLNYFGVAEAGARHPLLDGVEEARTRHPLLDGVEDFTVDEEPYMFEFDPFVKKSVFLEFEYDGSRYPAGWEHAYGLGRVVYLQPGHHAPSFQPAAYRQLVLNVARWAAR